MAGRLTIRGVYPVVATPFDADLAVHMADLERLVGFVAGSGVDGIVYPGNASEVDTLTNDERQHACEGVAARLGGQLPFIMGISSQNPASSLALAVQASRLGVNAVMLSPPVALRADYDAMRDLLARAGDVASCPVVLQNAAPPLGAGLEADVISRLAHDVPAVALIKEECSPSGHRISRHIAGAPPNVAVFGGAGGRFVMDELARGAAGYMPSCEIPEVHAAFMRAYWAGDKEASRGLYNAMLPLLVFTSLFRAAAVKAVLRLRGIIETDRHRIPVPPLDDIDRSELQLMMNGLAAVLPN